MYKANDSFNGVYVETIRLNDCATLDGAQALVGKWQKEAFPKASTTSILLKLYKEMGEFISNPSGQELADIQILVLGLAAHNDIDLEAEVSKKMAINVGRDWVEEPLGTMQHVEKEDAP